MSNHVSRDVHALARLRVVDKVEYSMLAALSGQPVTDLYWKLAPVVRGLRDALGVPWMPPIRERDHGQT